MKNPSKKLIAEARAKANELNHAILIGLPVLADRRQPPQLYDTGGTRKSFTKWRKNFEIYDVIWPDNHALGEAKPLPVVS